MINAYKILMNLDERDQSKEDGKEKLKLICFMFIYYGGLRAVGAMKGENLFD